MWSKIVEDKLCPGEDCGFFGDCHEFIVPDNSTGTLVNTTTFECVCQESSTSDGPGVEGMKLCNLPLKVIQVGYQTQLVLTLLLLSLFGVSQVRWIQAQGGIHRKTVTILLRNVFILMMPQWLILICAVRQVNSFSNGEPIYFGKDMGQTFLILTAFLFADIACLFAVKKSMAYHKKRNRFIANIKKQGAARRRSSTLSNMLQNETIQKHKEAIAVGSTVLLFWVPLMVMPYDDYGLMTINTMIIALIVAIIIIVGAYHFTTNAILKDYKEVQRSNSTNPSSNANADSEMAQAIKRGVRRVKATYNSVVYFCLFGLTLLFLMVPFRNIKLCAEILLAVIALPCMTLCQTVIILSRLLTKKKKRPSGDRKGTIMQSSVMPTTNSSNSSKGASK